MKIKIANTVYDTSNSKDAAFVQGFLKRRGADLGTYGKNKDGIDGRWGTMSLKAFTTYLNNQKSVLQSKASLNLNKQTSDNKSLWQLMLSGLASLGGVYSENLIRIDGITDKNGAARTKQELLTEKIAGSKLNYNLKDKKSVQELLKFLNSKGYNLEVDGVAGNKTLAALQEFNNLPSHYRYVLSLDTSSKGKQLYNLNIGQKILGSILTGTAFTNSIKQGLRLRKAELEGTPVDIKDNAKQKSYTNGITLQAIGMAYQKGINPHEMSQAFKNNKPYIVYLTDLDWKLFGHGVSGFGIVSKAFNDPARYTMGAGAVKFYKNGSVEVDDTGDYDFNYLHGGGSGVYSALRLLGYIFGVRESDPSGAKTHYSGKSNILKYE